jgi:hypothetical protein
MGEIDDLRVQLVENDVRTLGQRTQRLAELGNPDYSRVYPPIYEYLQELDKLYIDGHFMGVIVFSGIIIEHILRSKLFDIVSEHVVETASLGRLGSMAKRRKLITNISFERLNIVKEMRNTLVHLDSSSDFAAEMMNAACPDIDDPVIQQIWFFNGSKLDLMAKTCADIAKEFVAESISD